MKPNPEFRLDTRIWLDLSYSTEAKHEELNEGALLSYCTNVRYFCGKVFRREYLNGFSRDPETGKANIRNERNEEVDWKFDQLIECEMKKGRFVYKR